MRLADRLRCIAQRANERRRRAAIRRIALETVYEIRRIRGIR